jgi:DNA repair protein RecO (recombination protein O)
MNRLFRTEGIVLKSMRLNEADKIVTIYSCDYGKIRGIARGVRKTRSQFGSSMENLTIIKVLLYKGKNINTISQSEIISSFFPQTKDLFQYGIAIQCAEIVDKLTADEDPNRRVYTLFKKFLLLLKDEKNLSNMKLRKIISASTLDFLERFRISAFNWMDVFTEAPLYNFLVVSLL